MEAWDIILGAPVSQAGSIRHRGHGTKAAPPGDQPSALLGAVPTSAPSTSYYWGSIGPHGDLRDKAGSLARAMCTPGSVFSVKAQSLPVYGRGADSRGTLSSSSPAISPGLPTQFSRAFLSFGFHGDLGRQEIRQSFRQLCEGKQEAGRREAGQHRPAPPHQVLRPPISPCLKGTRARGGAEAPRRYPRQCRRENPGPQLWSKRLLLWPQAARCHGDHKQGPLHCPLGQAGPLGNPSTHTDPRVAPSARPPRSPVHCVSLLGKGHVLRPPWL